MTSDLRHDRPTSIDWPAVRHRLALVQAALDQGLNVSALEKKRILKERARALAQEPPPARAGEQLDVVAFLLADEKYGIESAFVREVYALKELTPVPCTPPFVLGITNVRGKITPVIDIKKFFDLPQGGLSELDKVVIVESNAMEVGIRADAVLGVQSVAPEEVQPGLPTLTGIREKYLKGVTPERLIILDIVKLMNDPDIIVNQEVED